VGVGWRVEVDAGCGMEAVGWVVGLLGEMCAG
jgi:hypothetical protein